MKKRVGTLIIVLLALAFLICAPAARGDGTLAPSGITPTPMPGPGQETATPRPTPTPTPELEFGTWLPLGIAANNE